MFEWATKEFGGGTRMRRICYAGFAAAIVLLAGCGGDDNATETTGTGNSTGGASVTGTAKPSGDIEKVSWALSYEPTSLNWVYAYNYAENTVLANVCENLMRLTPDYKIEPGLAESAEHPSPTKWVYTIRSGVTFNDGSPLTAADVVFSLRRHLDPKVGSYWGSWWANVKSVEKTAPMEVTVTLKRRDVIFPQMMATPAGAIESAAFVRKQGAKYGTPDGGLNCTGPFRLAKWSKGQNIKLVRNEGYWDSEHRARAAEADLSFLVAEATRTSALESGQVDGTFDVPPSALDKLEQSSAGKIFFGPSMQSFDVIVSNFKGPLGDVRVRRALLLALDRKGIVNAALGGRANVLRSVVSPSSWGYAEPTLRSGYDALPDPGVDLEAAKKLVEEAGSPSKPITLATLAEDQQLSVISLALKDAATKLGLNLNIKTLPVGKYAPLFFDAKARQGIDMFLTGWYTDIPEPLNMWATIFTSKGVSNYNGYTNPEYDRLIDEAISAEDPEARAALINKAQEIVTADVPWIPLYAPDVRVFLSNRVTGVPTTFVYLYYPWLADIGAA